VSAEHDLAVALAVRQACIRAVIDGYQQAAISGLCPEGAFEAAVDAVRMLEMAAVLQREETAACAAGTENIRREPGSVR
jgi:hypothetical protein